MGITLRVGLAQIATRLGDVEGNKERILASLERGNKEGVHIVLAPELSTLGYGSGDIYLDKVEDNLRSLEEIRAATKKLGVNAVVGYVDKDDLGFFYNSAALLGNGERLGSYRKVQLVNYRLFDEKRYFKRGTRLPVFDTPFGRLGILICEDVWYPEPARAQTFRGAEIILVLNSSPFDRGKIRLWEDILRQRVYDNLLPMAFVNQAGIQDGVTYWGGSMVLNALGDKIAQGKFLAEDFVVCDVDLDESKRLRRRDIRVREVHREVLEDLLQAYDEMTG
jgi:NAD+ synthase (glutamine-hydrolysing)